MAKHGRLPVAPPRRVTAWSSAPTHPRCRLCAKPTLACWRSITRPIGHAVGVAERVAAGQLDNRIEVARATMVSAEARKESRGAHVRDDAPDTAEFPNGRNDKEWLKHTLFSPVDNSITYKPVNMQPLTVEPVALKTRSY